MAAARWLPPWRSGSRSPAAVPPQQHRSLQTRSMLSRLDACRNCAQHGRPYARSCNVQIMAALRRDARRSSSLFVHMGMRRSAVTFHMKKLRDAGQAVKAVRWRRVRWDEGVHCSKQSARSRSGGENHETTVCHGHLARRSFKTACRGHLNADTELKQLPSAFNRYCHVAATVRGAANAFVVEVTALV